MITPSYSATATERVLPRLALDFTTASLDARVTVTRSLNTATRTNSSGILEIVNANLPRFDYDPSTLACKGLLIEEARTNLLLNSLINGTVLSTQAVAVTAVAYTISFYGTGTITLSGAHVAVVTGSGAYPSRKTYTFTPTAGALTVTVTGTVQFAQLEAGAFPTSYIPTTTTSLTRNADVVSMTGTNFSDWYNASEGAFVIRFSPATDAAKFAVSISNGTNNNRMQVMGWSSRQAQIVNGGSDQALFDNGTITPQAFNTVCMAYKLNNSALSLGGAVPATDATCTIPTVDRLYFGNATSGGDSINGHIAEFNYFPQRIINNEVRAFAV